MKNIITFSSNIIFVFWGGDCGVIKKIYIYKRLSISEKDTYGAQPK